MLRWIVASVFVSVSATAVVAQEPPREMHLAYYTVDRGWSSTLSLNNAEPRPLAVDVTLYGRSGEALPLPTLMLPGNSSHEISLAEVVAGRRELAEGSVEIRFASHNAMAVGTQLTLVDGARKLGLDLEPAMHQRSSTLEGLWWSLDAGSEVRIHFSNATASPVKVTPSLELRGTVYELEPRTLGPHALESLDLRSTLRVLGLPARTLGQGGFTLNHDGSAGAILAYGALLDQHGRYSANLPFVDPQGIATASFDGTGLPVGRPAAGSPFPTEARFSPWLVLRNLTTEPQTVRWHLQGRSEGEPWTKSSAPLELAPREIRRIELVRVLDLGLGNEVDDTAIRIETSGPPGSLLAALSSLDRGRGLVVDVPLLSVPPSSGFGGSHPFTLEKGFRSVAYLTNTSDQPTTASYLILHEGGHYSSGILELAPHETLSVDFQRLRDEGRPDLAGRTLPRDLARGQILWSPREPNALIGRVVRFDARTGRAANFSCPNCCGPTSDYYAFHVAPFSGWPGNFQGMEVDRYDRYCGWPDGPYRVTGQLAFSSEAPAIATASVGEVQYVSPGATNVVVSETLWYLDNISAEDCGWYPYQSQGMSPVDTNPTVNINGPETVPLGTKDSVTLTATGTPAGGTFSWSESSNNRVTLSATSGSSVTVKAGKPSEAENDVTVSVTYTVNGITTSPAQLQMTVRKPTSLVKTGTDTTTSEARCTTSSGAAGCGVKRTFVYQVKDQLGKNFSLATSTGGVTFYDTITTVAGQNGCNLSGYNTTCPMPGPCSQVTFGTFNETLSICAPACRSGVRCITGCTTTARQVWTVNGIDMPELELTYACNSIGIAAVPL